MSKSRKCTKIRLCTLSVKNQAESEYYDAVLVNGPDGVPIEYLQKICDLHWFRIVSRFRIVSMRWHENVLMGDRKKCLWEHQWKKHVRPATLIQSTSAIAVKMSLLEVIDICFIIAMRVTWDSLQLIPTTKHLQKCTLQSKLIFLFNSLLLTIWLHSFEPQ